MGRGHVAKDTHHGGRVCAVCLGPNCWLLATDMADDTASSVYVACCKAAHWSWSAMLAMRLVVVSAPFGAAMSLYVTQRPHRALAAMSPLTQDAVF